MGAFLAIILPTWTVLAMLIGLSLYDIYAVKKGPIRDIVNVAIEEEERMAMDRRRREQMQAARLGQCSAMCRPSRRSEARGSTHSSFAPKEVTPQ